MTRSSDISVVIPIYNAEGTIRNCLDALLLQTLEPVEIILVDNNSADRSKEIIVEYMTKNPRHFKYVNESKQGPSCARNRGVQESSGDIIAFTDADCVPDPKWLVEMRDAFDHLEIGAVAGNLKAVEPESLVQKFNSMFTLQGLDRDKIYHSYGLSYGGFAAANLAVRKDVFQTVQGFDESRCYGEDHDLCAKIYKARFCIRYTTGGIVRHIHRKDLLGTCRQAFYYAESHSYLIKKHFTRYVLIEFGRFVIRSENIPGRVWINVSSADKKAVFMVLLALWHPILIGLILAYFLFLCCRIYGKMKRRNMNGCFYHIFVFSGLLLLKSSCMTIGRIIGSTKYKVLCI